MEMNMSIRMREFDTEHRLAGFQRRGENYLHSSEFDRVVDLMGEVVRERHGSSRLASGVGNDMSGPYYVRQSFDRIQFHPDGIRGGMISLVNVEGR